MTAIEYVLQFPRLEKSPEHFHLRSRCTSMWRHSKSAVENYEISSVGHSVDGDTENRLCNATACNALHNHGVI